MRVACCMLNVASCILHLAGTTGGVPILFERGVACDVDVVSTPREGTLLVRSVMRRALVQGSSVTGAGLMELHLGWGPRALSLTYLREWMASSLWGSFFGPPRVDATLTALLRVLPRWTFSIHLKDGTMSHASAPHTTHLLLPPQSLTRGVWKYLMFNFHTIFTPGHAFISQYHPHHLASSIKVDADRMDKLGKDLLAASVLASLACCAPYFFDILRTRQRRRQLLLLQQQQQQQQVQQQYYDRSQLAAANGSASIASTANVSTTLGDDETQSEQDDAERDDAERDDAEQDDAERDDAESDAACIVCCEAARDCVLLPCAHQVVCTLCASKLLGSKCPVCRTATTRIIYVELEDDP